MEVFTVYPGGTHRHCDVGDGRTPSRLERYVQIYRDVLGADRMCLCGMFAAEYARLPEAIQEELRHFFDENERWLTDVLEQGRREGSLEFVGSWRDTAGLLTSALEGSMLLARSYGNDSRVGTAVEQVVATLRSSAPALANSDGE